MYLIVRAFKKTYCARKTFNLQILPSQKLSVRRAQYWFFSGTRFVGIYTKWISIGTLYLKQSKCK